MSTKKENEDGDILSFDLQEMLVGDEKEARKLVRKFNKGGDLMEMCDGLLPLTNGSTAAYEELEIFRERNCCHVGMAILYGFDNMLILLLDLGLDPNTRVNHWYHYSLLHMAAIDGSLRIARSLLDHDADPKRRDNLSFLPIHLAELNVNKPVYKLLLDVYNRTYLLPWRRHKPHPKLLKF